MANQIAAIEHVIERYLDMLYYCDVEILRDIFHPAAVYATADQTPLLHMDVGTYADVIAARKPPASFGEARKSEILSIDFAGENTAFVHLTCSFSDKDYIDFLTLIYTEDKWQIMSKIFHFTLRKPE